MAEGTFLGKITAFQAIFFFVLFWDLNLSVKHKLKVARKNPPEIVSFLLRFSQICISITMTHPPSPHLAFYCGN